MNNITSFRVLFPHSFRNSNPICRRLYFLRVVQSRAYTLQRCRHTRGSIIMILLRANNNKLNSINCIYKITHKYTLHFTKISSRDYTNNVFLLHAFWRFLSGKIVTIIFTVYFILILNSTTATHHRQLYFIVFNTKHIILKQTNYSIYHIIFILYFETNVTAVEA